MSSSYILTPDRTQGGGGGGGGAIGGTIAADQVAYGTALDTIGGTNNLKWINGTTTLAIGGNLYVTKALVFSKSRTTAVSDTALATDLKIRVVPVPPAAITITMDTVANFSAGQIVIIKDGNGFASAGTPLTISSVDLIDGLVSQVFTVAWTCVWLQCTGTTWDII